MRKRRGRGEGSIYQRADGTWCATISIGYGTDGRRRRRTLFAESKQDIHEKLRQQAGGIARLADLDSHRLRLGEYLDRWLRDAAQGSVRPTTYDNYQRTVNRAIKPHLGGVGLTKLTALHIQGMYSSLERDGNSPEKIRLVHAVLHRALKQAVRWRLIPFNMGADIERPRVPKKDIKPLTAAQVTALLKAAQGNRLEALYVVAVTTGMRLGEIFGLQWSDVDLQSGAIMVQHSLMELKGTLTLSEPKTHRGRRKIDLPQLTVDALWQHKANLLAEGLGGVRWVFCNASGGSAAAEPFSCG